MDSYIIHLGASTFPHSELSDNEAFLSSSSELGNYMKSAFFVENDDKTLNLFNSKKNTTDQLVEIEKFISSRLKKSSTFSPSFFIHYVGHGFFPSNADAIYWGIKSTTDTVNGSAIRVEDFASTISQFTHSAKFFLIVDCCFSESVVKQFMSKDAVSEKIFSGFDNIKDKTGVAILCSASSSEYSYAPDNHKYTLFTQAFLESISTDIDKEFQNILSLDQLCYAINNFIETLDLNFRSTAKVHDPQQSGEKLSTVPIFPKVAPDGSIINVGNIPITKDEEILARDIEKRCVEAQSGILQSIRDAGIEKTAYAVTSRIKPYSDILSKVDRKRNKEGRKNYSVSDVNDALGVRVICLFEEDIFYSIETICKLIVGSKLPDGQHLSPNYLHPGNIHKATIYSSSYVERVTGFEKKCQNRIERALGIEDIENNPLEINIELRKDYTSIHIIAFINSRENREAPIPLEFQIRSVFEDSWAQIDHKLRYSHSREKNHETQRNIPISSEQHLVILKQLLDAVTNYSTTISKEISNEKPVRKQRLQAIDGRSSFIETAASLGVDEQLTATISELISEKEAIDKKTDSYWGDVR